VLVVGDSRGAYIVLVGSPKERVYLEDLSVDGRTIEIDLEEVGMGRHGVHRSGSE